MQTLGTLAPLIFNSLVWDVHRTDGCYLPANSAMCLDPSLFPEPDVFMPERFLEPKSTPANFTIPFGFGRRICPGIDVAEQSLFITFAR